MSQGNVGCKDCKRFREHVTSLLPFKVLEAMSDKPLRIRGVAMCTGMSRNLNIYTSEELQNFSSKLTNAPVYIEHVGQNPLSLLFEESWRMCFTSKLGFESLPRRHFSIASSFYDRVRSKRSRFITLFHAATKSCRNFSWESSHA
jgi:hypothetical protein